MKASKAGSRSLKRYEVTNLLFLLTIAAVLIVVGGLVFNHYRSINKPPSQESDLGVVSEALNPGSDVGMFYLGTAISETSLQYKSRLEIPVTDDGLVRDLFALPGVEEVTIDRTMIILRKIPSTRWENIQPGVRRIVSNHLHPHF